MNPSKKEQSEIFSAEEMHAYAEVSKDLYRQAKECGDEARAKALRHAARSIVRYAKPLKGKTYSSIPHLAGSLVLDEDVMAREKVEKRLTREPKRDDHILVEEKLDGSCVGVARVQDRIIAIGRSGYAATVSPHGHIREFAAWAAEQEGLFMDILRNGERLVGEWLAEAMGIRYKLPHGPFVAFDLMEGWNAIRRKDLDERIAGRLPQPHILCESPAMMNAEEAMKALKSNGRNGFHGALETAEGAVWRCECKQRNRVLTMGKFVRPDFPAGRYMQQPGRVKNEYE